MHAALPERPLVGRPLRHRLRPGVDLLVADGQALGPGGHEAPSQQREHPGGRVVAGTLPDDGHPGPRRDVVVGLTLPDADLAHPEALREELRRRRRHEPTAHPAVLASLAPGSSDGRRRGRRSAAPTTSRRWRRPCCRRARRRGRCAARVEDEIGGDARRLLRPRDPQPTVGLERARHRRKASRQLGLPRHEEHDHVEAAARLAPDLHAVGQRAERVLEAVGRRHHRETRPPSLIPSFRGNGVPEYPAGDRHIPARPLAARPPVQRRTSPRRGTACQPACRGRPRHAGVS